MLLLELGHVDGDQILFTAVEQIGQSQRCFGFSHTAGTAHQEHSQRFARIGKTGTGGSDCLCNFFNRSNLSDNTLADQLLKFHQSADFILNHVSNRNSGPQGNYRGNGIVTHTCKNQRNLALNFVKLVDQRIKFLLFRKRLNILAGLEFVIKDLLQFYNFCYNLLFSFPVLLEFISSSRLFRNSVFKLFNAFRLVRPHRILVVHGSKFLLQTADLLS